MKKKNDVDHLEKKNLAIIKIVKAYWVINHKTDHILAAYINWYYSNMYFQLPEALIILREREKARTGNNVPELKRK